MARYDYGLGLEAVSAERGSIRRQKRAVGL